MSPTRTSVVWFCAFAASPCLQTAPAWQGCRISTPQPVTCLPMKACEALPPYHAYTCRQAMDVHRLWLIVVIKHARVMIRSRFRSQQQNEASEPRVQGPEPRFHLQSSLGPGRSTLGSWDARLLCVISSLCQALNFIALSFLSRQVFCTRPFHRYPCTNTHSLLPSTASRRHHPCAPFAVLSKLFALPLLGPAQAP